MVDINTTPLIDVMLVLLIMFIITIPIMTHAVKLDMPRPNAADAAAVAAGGRSTSKSTSTARSTGTARPIDEATLLRLPGRCAAARSLQPEIHLRPEQAREVRLRGAGAGGRAALDVKKIGFAGNEQFM